jgi:Family of unknown function (DUF6308)
LTPKEIKAGRLPVVLRDRDVDRATALWRRYFSEARSPGTPLFTGSRFERFKSVDNRRAPNEITSDDLIAVSMLGVHVPAAAAIRILDRDHDQISSVLKDIPHTPLADAAPDAVAVGTSGASRLWRLLRDERDGMGPTTTSKLMARKRPHLIPVWDGLVGHATGQDTLTHWDWMRDVLRADNKFLHRWLRDTADQAGDWEDIGVLRLFDVLVWLTESDRRASERRAARRG